MDRPILKSRRSFPPGGFVFTEARTGWSASPGMTFDQVVDALIGHRLANPRYAGQWATDKGAVEDEVDTFTALNVMMLLGAQNRIGAVGEYVVMAGGGGDVPKKVSLPVLGRLRRVGAAAVAVVGGVKRLGIGIGTLLDWLGSGGEPVGKELAESRAGVCDGCPKNDAGDWTRFFTVPVARQLKQQMEIRKELDLSTSHDTNLHVCSACNCVLPLMVFVPLEHKLKHLTPEIRSDLDPRCWVLKEEGAMKENHP